MQTETANQFKRKARMGLNLLSLEDKVPVYIKVTAYDVFTSKNYPDGIPYFDVVNLKTGEEQRMWLDGGMKGQFSQNGGFEGQVGKALEITRTGSKPFSFEDANGKEVKTEVNVYEIFELDV